MCLGGGDSRPTCYALCTYSTRTFGSLLLCTFNVSKRTLQQSFTYPNLAAVYHVSKPCSSLSRIQTLQQSLRYPNLAGSSLEDVPQVHQITDFKLCYTRNTHYYSVVALDGYLCSEFPTLQTSAVETDTIVVQNYFVVAINNLYYAPVLLTLYIHSSTKLKMRVLERYVCDGVNPIILI